MKALAARGFVQAVLPPRERPNVAALRALGFAGNDSALLAAAARQAPHLLAACTSAAAMWVANAATVSPSGDTADGRVHFTPANLVTHFHRSLEAATTTRVLRSIFADERHFAVHNALPAAPQLGDEGAPTTRALSSQRVPPASSSSSTDAPPLPPTRWRHGALRRDRRARPAKALPAATGLLRSVRYLPSSTPRRLTPAYFITT